MSIALRPISFAMSQTNLHGNSDIPSHFHGWVGVLDSVLSNKGVNHRTVHLHSSAAAEPTQVAVKGGESRRGAAISHCIEVAASRIVLSGRQQIVAAISHCMVVAANNCRQPHHMASTTWHH